MARDTQIDWSQKEGCVNPQVAPFFILDRKGKFTYEHDDTTHAGTGTSRHQPA
jgi:hypothetical protein